MLNIQARRECIKHIVCIMMQLISISLISLHECLYDFSDALKVIWKFLRAARVEEGFNSFVGYDRFLIVLFFFRFLVVRRILKAARVG